MSGPKWVQGAPRGPAGPPSVPAVPGAQGQTQLSLGIGLTNACNLKCAHCYRPRGAAQHLGLDDVVRCLDRFDVASVTLGTGENILNPALPAVLDELERRGVRTSLTSNGLSLGQLDEARLVRLHDVEVSFDFATRAELDAFRGRGAFDLALRAVERCVALGLKVTILAVLMRINWDRLASVAKLAARLGASFRVNVFQPVHETGHMPSWEQLWGGFRRLFGEAEVVTCTEPVVAALLPARAGSAPRPCGCGRTSLRLLPGGELLPCVYWPRPAAMLADLDDVALFQTKEFKAARSVPDVCRSCPLFDRCGGGCPARRALTTGLDAPDPFCPRRHGTAATPLHASFGTGPDLLHAANVCTTIVRAG